MKQLDDQNVYIAEFNKPEDSQTELLDVDDPVNLMIRSANSRRSIHAANYLMSWSGKNISEQIISKVSEYDG
jgi:hypothetical protein